MGQSQVVQASQGSTGDLPAPVQRRGAPRSAALSVQEAAIAAGPGLVPRQSQGERATQSAGRLPQPLVKGWPQHPPAGPKTETDAATAARPPGRAAGQGPGGASFPSSCVRIGNAEGFRSLLLGRRRTRKQRKTSLISCVLQRPQGAAIQTRNPATTTAADRHTGPMPQLWTGPDRAGEPGSPHGEATGPTVSATTGTPHSFRSWHPAS